MSGLPEWAFMEEGGISLSLSLTPHFYYILSFCPFYIWLSGRWIPALVLIFLTLTFSHSFLFCVAFLPVCSFLSPFSSSSPSQHPNYCIIVSLCESHFSVQDRESETEREGLSIPEGEGGGGEGPRFGWAAEKTIFQRDHLPFFPSTFSFLPSLSLSACWNGAGTRHWAPFGTVEEGGLSEGSLYSGRGKPRAKTKSHQIEKKEPLS